jgi:hypothetical protein
MATPIKQVERDFLLKFLFDEQIPLMYLRNQTEYVLKVAKAPKNELFLKPDRPITGLDIGQSMELVFDYHGQVIIFSGKPAVVEDDGIVMDVPESLYKNRDRSYIRVNVPADISLQLSFLGDQYFLAFPKVTGYEAGGEPADNMSPKNIALLIGQFGGWIKNHASGYKLVLFKDVKPVSIEECVIAETGKTLYLPSLAAALPKEDPYPRKRLITEERFRKYLESTGVAPVYIDDAVSRFVRSKIEKGFFSDAWVPIPFQQYVIGYIHIWINKPGMPPFDYRVIEAIDQFAKVLAFSLKASGYFASNALQKGPFEGNLIDISASGFLFTYPHSPLADTLLADGALLATFVTPRRTINTTVKIVRRYKDQLRHYFGCRCLDMAAEDMRFLFEYIYGKSMTDINPVFLSGQI